MSETETKKDWKIGFWGGLKQIFQETRKAREGIDQLLEPAGEGNSLETIEQILSSMSETILEIASTSDEQAKFRDQTDIALKNIHGTLTAVESRLAAIHQEQREIRQLLASANRGRG